MKAAQSCLFLCENSMVSFKSLYSFSKKEIDTAFKEVHPAGSILGLKLLQTPPSEKPHGKLLIIIPRAVGTAVVRNKIRRQIKAVFYEERLYEKLVTSIVLIYKQATKIGFEELKKFLVKNIV